MKELSYSLILAGLLTSATPLADAQARFAPGGGGGGYSPGNVEPYIVLPYANGAGGGGGGPISAPQAPLMGGPGQGQALAGPNAIEQAEDMADQQQPSMIVSDPDDSALAQPPMDDPQDASGFEGLQSIDNVDADF